MKTTVRPKLLAAMPGLIAALVIVAFVVGAYWNAGQPEREAIELVKRSLRDPSSAEFRGVRTKSFGQVCGEVNAKNGYGGMAGFKAFLVSPSADGSLSVSMGEAAAILCR